MTFGWARRWIYCVNQYFKFFLMFNTFAFNVKSYNAISPNSIFVLEDGMIQFDGFNLQDVEIVSSAVDTVNAPDRQYETTDVPRGDGQLQTGDSWKRKIVRVQGVVHSASAVALAEKIDNMKRALSEPEGNLDMAQNGQVRRYVCTWVNPGSAFGTGEQGSGVTFQNYNLDFEVNRPFGYALNYTSKSLFDQTNLALSEQVNNTGTATTEPTMILVFTAATSISAVQFINTTTGRGIKVEHFFSAGDVLEINSTDKKVAVNDTEVDFEGAFPRLKVGSNAITLDITGTSATYDMTVKHLKAYL